MTVQARRQGRWLREHFDAAADPRIPDARAAEPRPEPEPEPDPDQQATELTK